MELKQKLIFCKQCQHKKLDTQVGIVCGLTNNKPDFEETCPSYLNDPKETRRMVKKAEKLYKTTGSTSSGASTGSVWRTIIFILIIIKLIMRFAR